MLNGCNTLGRGGSLKTKSSSIRKMGDVNKFWKSKPQILTMLLF